MAYSNGLRCITLQAAGDLSTRQYHAIDLSGNLGCVLPAANKGHGILQNHPNSGEAATVAVDGETRARAGGAISQNDYVTAAATGYLTAVGSAGTNGRVLGRAKTAAASGSIFTMEINVMAVMSMAAI